MAMHLLKFGVYAGAASIVVAVTGDFDGWSFFAGTMAAVISIGIDMARREMAA